MSAAAVGKIDFGGDGLRAQAGLALWVFDGLVNAVKPQQVKLGI